MISIITPVLNERGNIPFFLEHIRELEGEFELIIVDGGSTDGTLEEVERLRGELEHPLVVLGAARGRGSQMNRGAAAAKGDILLFLHVDCQIERDSLGVIEREIRKSKTVGGGFTHSFSEPDIFLRLSSKFGNLRAERTGIFFGDFGIFMRRDVFEDVGGYDDIPFLEDVELCRKAGKKGRLKMIDRLIITSPRRYHAKGKIRLTTVFILAYVLNMMGFRPGFLYRYIVKM